MGGAHTKGLNSQSLGVCLIGKTNFTEEQFLSLESVLKNGKNTLMLKLKVTVMLLKLIKHVQILMQDWCQRRNLMKIF